MRMDCASSAVARSIAAASSCAALQRATARDDAERMAPGPRIFATFVRSTLDTIDRHDAALGARVRARLAPTTVATLASASAVSYVPVELDVEVTECLFAEAGAGTACDVLRENFSISLDSPLLSALVHGALRLFGRSPGRVLRWSSRMWSQLYRDAGSVEWIDDGPTSGRLEMRDLPACIAGSRPYLVGMAAAIDASFETMGVHGEVRVERSDAAARSATLRVDWKG
jgi:hypothetical protein